MAPATAARDVAGGGVVVAVREGSEVGSWRGSMQVTRFLDRFASHARHHMAASNRSPISAEARAALGEAIRLVFARWTALQVAVENRWGGRDSCAKANQLGKSILSWFCRSKGPHLFEDLVLVMDDKISEFFNADLDDNSIQDVADQLLFIHEQCLQSNYIPVEQLRNSHVQANDLSQSRQIVADDGVISNDADDASMMNEEAAAAEETAVDLNAAPDTAGWTVAPPRRRGRRAN